MQCEIIINSKIYLISSREEWCEEVISRVYGPIVGYRFNLDISFFDTKLNVSNHLKSFFLKE